MAKPDEVVFEDYPDVPVREITRRWIDRVRGDFSIGADEKLPTENIFQKWCALNGKFDYEDSGVYGYNRIFLPRVFDLRDGTPESQETFFSDTREAFDGFDYEKQGYTVSFFLNSESNMRELMRAVVRQHLPQWGKLGDEIVLHQSSSFQTAMYDYFEGVLKTALADNVRLLHGILPQKVATELKRTGFVEPVYFKDAAVLFTDFEGFSQFTKLLSPAEVIRRLDAYFTEFDRISAVYGLEKIKTIGDSYMAVAGVPEPHPDPGPRRVRCRARRSATLANRISDLSAGTEGWKIRIGIHVGTAHGRRHRQAEIQLRRLGRHGEFRQPHGIERRAGPDQCLRRGP